MSLDRCVLKERVDGVQILFGVFKERQCGQPANRAKLALGRRSWAMAASSSIRAQWRSEPLH